MTITPDALVSVLLELRRQMVLCTQVAYREWTLHDPTGTSNSSHGLSCSPLPIDPQAWDEVQNADDLLQEIWGSLGHERFPEWPHLITGMIADAHHMSESTLADQWAKQLHDAVRRLKRITDRPAAPAHVVLSPTQIADYLHTEYRISTDKHTVLMWIARGKIKAKKVSYGKYAISTGELNRFAKARLDL